MCYEPVSEFFKTIISAVNSIIGRVIIALRIFLYLREKVENIRQNAEETFHTLTTEDKEKCDKVIVSINSKTEHRRFLKFLCFVGLLKKKDPDTNPKIKNKWFVEFLCFIGLLKKKDPGTNHKTKHKRFLKLLYFVGLLKKKPQKVKKTYKQKQLKNMRPMNKPTRYRYTPNKQIKNTPGGHLIARVRHF